MEEKNINYFSEFEDLAIQIVELFDKIEEHDFEMISEVSFCNVNLLKISLDGNCQKFVSTFSAQRIITKIWENSFIFYPEEIISYDFKNHIYSSVS